MTADRDTPKQPVEYVMPDQQPEETAECATYDININWALTYDGYAVAASVK